MNELFQRLRLIELVQQLTDAGAIGTKVLPERGRPRAIELVDSKPICFGSTIRLVGVGFQPVIPLPFAMALSRGRPALTTERDYEIVPM